MSKHSKEYDAFTGLMDALLAVPHAEIKKRMEKHKAEADKNPRKRGPKRKTLGLLALPSTLATRRHFIDSGPEA